MDDVNEKFVKAYISAKTKIRIQQVDVSMLILTECIVFQSEMFPEKLDRFVYSRLIESTFGRYKTLAQVLIGHTLPWTESESFSLGLIRIPVSTMQKLLIIFALLVILGACMTTVSLL